MSDHESLSPEQLEKMRRDFVANVSHELRTPLTVIAGYVETMLQKQAEFPEKWRPVFAQMQQHTTRMEHLVEDLLLLSKLEATEPDPEALEVIDVVELLRQLAHDAENISGEAKHIIELEVDPKLQLRGIRSELQSVFANLIINAVKYTPENGEITIHWYADKGAACFAVRDAGIGIAAEHLPRLTERFYRVDKARSRASGGTGLGLAIVKHVLLRHDAELMVQSEEGVGSEFTCVFPAKRSVFL